MVTLFSQKWVTSTYSAKLQQFENLKISKNVSVIVYLQSRDLNSALHLSCADMFWFYFSTCKALDNML